MNGGDVKKELANPSIQTILLVLNLAAMIAGFGAVWGVQSARIDSVSVALAVQTGRVEAMDQHYQVLLSQVVALQADIKYMSQGIAELKLRK